MIRLEHVILVSRARNTAKIGLGLIISMGHLGDILSFSKKLMLLMHSNIDYRLFNNSDSPLVHPFGLKSTVRLQGAQALFSFTLIIYNFSRLTLIVTIRDQNK